MPINYSNYPPDWSEIRNRILKRANNRCEGDGCGLKNHVIILKTDRRTPNNHLMQMYQSLLNNHYSKPQAMRKMGFTEIVLTIAHLDHDKDNFAVKDERLKALCQKCHLQYDLSRHIENRKYGRDFRKHQIKLDI